MEEDFAEDQTQGLFLALIRYYRARASDGAVRIEDDVLRGWVSETVKESTDLMRVCIDATASPESLPDVIETLKEKSRLRKLKQLAEGVLAGVKAGKKASETVEYLSGALSRLGGIRREPERLRSLIEKILEVAASAKENAEPVVKWGLTLDRYWNPVDEYPIMVLAGRPGFGKTALAGYLARKMAERGKHTLFFSLEQPALVITARMLAPLLGCDVNAVFEVARREGPRLAEIAKRDWTGKVLLHEKAYTMPDIVSMAQFMHQRVGIDLIVVDYLQLIANRDKEIRTRNDQISAFMAQFSELRKQLSAPLLIISQLSRAPGQRTDPRPQLTDLRDSGAIEQVADIVYMIYCKDVREDQREIILAKNKNGPTGSVDIFFDKERMIISDLESRR